MEDGRTAVSVLGFPRGKRPPYSVIYGTAHVFGSKSVSCVIFLNPAFVSSFPSPADYAWLLDLKEISNFFLSNHVIW